jgi:hypothetical protein
MDSMRLKMVTVTSMSKMGLPISVILSPGFGRFPELLALLVAVQVLPCMFLSRMNLFQESFR